MRWIPRVFFAMTASSAAWAAGSAWPVCPSTQAALAGRPGPALVKVLRAEADVAFDRHDFGAAVALRRLERLEESFAAHPVPDELRRWFHENRAVAEEFAALYSADDDAAAVARILTALWTGDEAAFRKYPSLACAIALVYDKPCPAGFPHGQVKPSALPRRLHPPAEVFRFYAESAAAGRLLLSPQRLGMDELAFVVSVLAPPAELRDAQRMRLTRADIPKLYPSIVYDRTRLDAGVFTWPYDSYSLETIRKRGGICVDQAYYTTTVAQAFGVPAFILCGAGNQGYHAFSGYLERAGKWRTDVGRYPGQQYATGEAINPLNWKPLTDHDLEFLEARFRTTPAYATVLLHVVRGREAMAAGDLPGAEKLLRAAQRMEPRCPEVWRALAESAEARADPPQSRLLLYREAAKALGRYREAEISWRTAVAATLDSMGKADEALAERLAIVRRNATARPDLAVDLAAKVMARVLEEGNSKRTMAVFNTLLGQFTDAGPDFYTAVVFPVIDTLDKQGHQPDARKLVRAANQRFKADPGSQLAAMQRSATARVERIRAFNE